MTLPSRWKPVIAAAAAALFIAVLGALSTDLGDWYGRLLQPAWKPPDAWFGPIWTVIYALAAVAGVRAWRVADTPSRRESLLLLFALNGCLNVLWSLLFFRLRRPDWALAEVGFLWMSILLLMGVLGRRQPLVAALLAPYLVWVSLASLLNFDVVRLNAPFGPP